MLDITTIYSVLDTNNPNTQIQERFLQGNTDKIFKFKLLKNNEEVTLSSNVKPSIVLVYYTNNKIIAKYKIAAVNADGTNNANYNITIDNNCVLIPFRNNFQLVDHEGRTDLILDIDDNGKFYSYSCTYVVDPNEAYNPVGIIDNLPNLNAITQNINNMQKDISVNKDEIDKTNKSLNTKANLNLDNVGDFRSTKNTEMLMKDNDKLTGTGITVDKKNKLVTFPYKVKIPPNTLDLGENINLHENGGFLEYGTKTLNENFILLDYENDTIRGSKKPVYYERKAQIRKVLHSGDTVALNDVGSIALGQSTEDFQVNSIYLKVVNPVKNFRFAININGTIVAYYPSREAWEGTETGYDLGTGLQVIDIKPNWTVLREYTRLLLFRAENPINLFGGMDGFPYYSVDCNPITRKDIALMEDITAAGKDTAEEIRDKLTTLQDINRLSYNTLKDTPNIPVVSGPNIKTMIEQLQGDERLDYNSLKNSPTIPTVTGPSIKTLLEALSGNNRLDASAIKGLDKIIVSNVDGGSSASSFNGNIDGGNANGN